MSIRDLADGHPCLLANLDHVRLALGRGQNHRRDLKFDVEVVLAQSTKLQMGL